MSQPFSASRDNFSMNSSVINSPLTVLP